MTLVKILVNHQIILFVKPHSKKIFINQINSETFEIAITSRPEKGKANKEIIMLLSEFLKINKNRIRIIQGHKSRKKIVQIADL